VRPVGLDDLLSSRATALPPHLDGGRATTHERGLALRWHHDLLGLEMLDIMGPKPAVSTSPGRCPP